MWILALLPFCIPIASPVALVAGALLTLASNAVAIYLLFSPVKADWMNAGARLTVQLATLVAVCLLILRFGIPVDSVTRLFSGH
jgi:hypothetical protein